MQAASTSDISCAGVSATFTPSGRSGAALAAVRFHTVTWKPLVARFFAIRTPINPSPRNPTRWMLAICSFLLAARHPGVAGARRLP